MFFKRWHPEVAIRYLPIVKEINALDRPTVLEVGSGGLGIAPYLNRSVTGLDTHFSPPFHPSLTKKIGNGTKIPFPDKSFDVVIAVDILEHVKPVDRAKVVSEIRRVAKKEIIIAVPT
ncbi:class I SAM-dependent methyltransferase, partial [Candidatus Microgenomates bacterium]|nr:class I SAM-dependent methyltransferase [Candidatus Microgenomates bacterium]